MSWIREDSMNVMFECRAEIIAFAMVCLFRRKITMQKALYEIAYNYGRDLGFVSRAGDVELSLGEGKLITAYALILSDPWFDYHDTFQYVRIKDLTKTTRLMLKKFSSVHGMTPASVIRQFNSMRKWVGIQKFNTYKSMKY